MQVLPRFPLPTPPLAGRPSLTQHPRDVARLARLSGLAHKGGPDTARVRAATTPTYLATSTGPNRAQRRSWAAR